MHSPGSVLLWALLIGIIAGALVTLLAIRKWISREGPSTSFGYRSPILTLIAYTLILTFYPNTALHSKADELVRIATSVVLFFVTLSQLIPFMLPGRYSLPAVRKRTRKRMRWLNWLLAVFAGIAVGLFALYGEAAENHQGQHKVFVPTLVMVTLVYFGTTTFAAVIAYLTLRKPLGLYARNK